MVGDYDDVLGFPFDDFSVKEPMGMLYLSFLFVGDLDGWQLLVRHALVARVIEPVKLFVEVEGREPSEERCLELASRRVCLELVVVQVEQESSSYTCGNNDPLFDCSL